MKNSLSPSVNMTVIVDNFINYVVNSFEGFVENVTKTEVQIDFCGYSTFFRFKNE